MTKSKRNREPFEAFTEAKERLEALGQEIAEVIRDQYATAARNAGYVYLTTDREDARKILGHILWIKQQEGHDPVEPQEIHAPDGETCPACGEIHDQETTEEIKRQLTQLLRGALSSNGPTPTKPAKPIVH